jgi:hypothetical protein
MHAFLRFGALGILVAALAGAGSPASARRPSLAGPPMICQPFDIGDARSLPAETSSARVTKETLALLAPGTAPIVRMETIRRAVMAAEAAPRRELFSALQSRVLDAEARGAPSAEAWFDAGYYIATWEQLDTAGAPEVGVSDACTGYAWIKKAISLAKAPAEMEFAAALAVHPAMHKGTHEAYQAHLARAAAGAAPGSAYEKNIRNHCTNWRESYDDLKQKGKDARDPGAKR